MAKPTKPVVVPHQVPDNPRVPPTPHPAPTPKPTSTLRPAERNAARFALGLIGTSTRENPSNPSADNHNYCLGTVSDAFTNNPSLHNNQTSPTRGYGYAQQFIDTAKSHGNVTQGAPGAGDVALYSGGDYGHVALGIGNGYVVSGDIAFDKQGQPHYSTQGQYHRIPYDKLATIFGKKYEGYTEGTSRVGGRDNNADAPFSGGPTKPAATAPTRVAPVTPDATPSPSAGPVAAPPAPTPSPSGSPSGFSLANLFGFHSSTPSAPAAPSMSSPTASAVASSQFTPKSSSTEPSASAPAPVLGKPKRRTSQVVDPIGRL